MRNNREIDHTLKTLTDIHIIQMCIPALLTRKYLTLITHQCAVKLSFSQGDGVWFQLHILQHLYEGAHQNFYTSKITKIFDIRFPDFSRFYYKCNQKHKNPLANSVTWREKEVSHIKQLVWRSVFTTDQLILTMNAVETPGVKCINDTYKNYADAISPQRNINNK